MSGLRGGALGFYEDGGEFITANPGSLWFSSVTMAAKYIFGESGQWSNIYPFYPWNPEHACFVDFQESTLEHDMHYEDTSQGDEIYFQQSGHMQCVNCGHCEAADGSFYDDSGPEDYL